MLTRLAQPFTLGKAGPTCGEGAWSQGTKKGPDAGDSIRPELCPAWRQGGRTARPGWQAAPEGEEVLLPAGVPREGRSAASPALPLSWRHRPSKDMPALCALHNSALQPCIFCMGDARRTLQIPVFVRLMSLHRKGATGRLTCPAPGWSCDRAGNHAAPRSAGSGAIRMDR